jgi:myo-inositol 2-dehydrogenase/D-chiro-inositol 1-dehydrogenase
MAENAENAREQGHLFVIDFGELVAQVANHSLRLTSLFDVQESAAATGCSVAGSVAEMLADLGVEAVLIASATNTHAALIEAAAAAGKAIFCEKPIDTSLARIEQCAAAIASFDVPIQIGFNRRFDPGHKAARDAVQAGEIGALHQVIITSRDPDLPSRAYLETAGGLFRDMIIHDFDLARFMLGEDPVEVFAIADALIDPALGKAIGEVDTAMIVMRTASGKMCHINNSRTAVYGYDQRVELLGDASMLISGNRKPHALTRYSATAAEQAEPYEHFFLERYREAFALQLDAFADAIEQGRPCEVGFEDDRQAMRLAEAAYLSLAQRRMVLVEEVRA